MCSSAPERASSGCRARSIAISAACSRGSRQLEVNDVWLEAGARLDGAFLQARLVDELIVYIAPRLLGDGARGMFAGPALESLADAWRLSFDEIREIDG